MLSIITPTYNRNDHLIHLYDLILAQKTEEKWEWLILDDSPIPSSFFSQLKDPKVHYHHHEKKQSVGHKRDFLSKQAQGDLIVHMDDDDYYAPHYLQKVAQELKEADFFSLSSWFCYFVPQGEFFYWDTQKETSYCFVLTPFGEISMKEHSVVSEKIAKGFGFSYAYNKKVLSKARFSHLSFGEDLDFFEQVESNGFCIKNVPDQEGLALVMRHDIHLSQVFPQYRIPSFLGHRLFPEFGHKIAKFRFCDQNSY